MGPQSSSGWETPTGTRRSCVACPRGSAKQPLRGCHPCRTYCGWPPGLRSHLAIAEPAPVARTTRASSCCPRGGSAVAQGPGTSAHLPSQTGAHAWAQLWLARPRVSGYSHKEANEHVWNLKIHYSLLVQIAPLRRQVQIILEKGIYQGKKLS